MRRLYKELRRQHTALAKDLDKIRAEALEIWREPHLRRFTEHAEPHIEQVENNLDDLAQPLQESRNPLTPEEIFVLLAACNLHDIGMQLDVPDARERHAEYSYQLILHSKDDVGREHHVRLSIHDRNARQAIALVAQAHWTSYALKLPQEDHILGNKTGRLRLLGLLLAMADLLDLSPVRARYFRSVHRLYGLDPVGELHQVLHEQVKGFTIEPPDPKVPGDLQFTVKWQDKGGQVRKMSDWILHWFSSQWRQLEPVLYRDSGGAIGWARPWARSVFKERLGPSPLLSPAALAVLEAELAEQRRIGREAFVSAFESALEEGKSLLCTLCLGSHSDGPHLSRWCLAKARCREGTRAAQVESRNLSEMIRDLMTQWKLELQDSVTRLDDPRLFRMLLEQESDHLVAVVNTATPHSRSVKQLLERFLGSAGSAGTGARIFVLLSPNAEAPEVPSSLGACRIEDTVLSKKALQDHLATNWGLDPKQSEEMAQKAGAYRFLEAPGMLYTLIDRECRAWSHEDSA